MRLGRRRQSRVQKTDLGGVSCFYGDAPPPFAATLIFRVGRVDETLRTSGLTHLVEHLVMPAEPPGRYERNARVDGLYAIFWASGQRDEVLEFVGDTCAAIREPPLHRIETERQILQTEAAGRGYGPIDGAMALRYGAIGPGLLGHDEHGLAWVGPEEVSHWIAERLTADNAACWLTGRPPSGFTLDLPSGQLLAPPEPTLIEGVDKPTYFPVGPPGQVAVAMEGERSTALSTAFEILRGRAWRTLRYEKGFAYEIGDWYEPLSASTSAAVLWVDSLEHNARPASEGLLELLDDLCTKGPTAEELADEARGARRALDDPLSISAELHYSATEALLGRSYSLEEIVRKKEALSAVEAAEALAAARANMLLVLPEGVEPPQGISQYPLNASRRVEGRRFRAKGLRLYKEVRGTALLLAPEGLSVESASGDRSTVLFADCELVLHWSDGSRTLFGRDGFKIHVDPTAWRKGNEIVASIDAELSPDLIVRMERELSDRISAVDSLVKEKLKRRWVVSEELDSLPELLEDDERLLTFAEANRGLRAGLLVVTDRRVLWVYAPKPERMLDVARADVRSVRARKGTPLLADAKVWVETPDEVVEFEDIVPRERAGEIRDLLSGGGESEPS